MVDVQDLLTSTDDVEVTVDRRRGSERRGLARTAPPAAVRGERRKVQRRRQIDPTTCERDYSNDEIEFMQAMDEYKRANGRMFPTCSEILEVVRSLGYAKLEADAASATTPAEPALANAGAESRNNDR